MLGIRFRNEEIGMRTRVYDVAQSLATAKWQWAGHVAREDPDRWTARAVRWRPRASKRSVGRPQKRWYDDIKRVEGLKWLQRAQDKKLWQGLRETFVQEWTGIG